MLPLLFFVRLLPAPSKGVAGTSFPYLAGTSFPCLSAHIPKPAMDENLQEDALLSLSECAPLNLPPPLSLSLSKYIWHAFRKRSGSHVRIKIRPSYMRVFAFWPEPGGYY